MALPPQEEKSFINTPIQDMMKKSESDSTVGPLVGSVIIILIIIIGGLYFLNSFILNKKTEIKADQEQAQQEDTQQVEQAAKQSNSDDVNSIEADLKTTNIDSTDSDYQEIEKEF